MANSVSVAPCDLVIFALSEILLMEVGVTMATYIKLKCFIFNFSHHERDSICCDFYALFRHVNMSSD